MAGKISALRFQKRNRERVNVYLDGEYAFALPAVLASSLKLGQHLSDEEIARLEAQNTAEQAYERALHFLSYRPRSVAEVRRSLEKHGVPDEVIDGVVQRLTTAGYLDDAEFARFWVSGRDRFSPRSPMALRQELRTKGVANQIIEQALAGLDSEESAYRAGTERARRLANLDERTFRQKLGSYLLRRGFPHDVVWPLVGRIWRELGNDEAGENIADEV